MREKRLKWLTYAATLSLGLVLGAMWYRANIFPFPQVDHLRQHFQTQGNLPSAEPDTPRAVGPPKILRIPMRYYPVGRVVTDDDGSQRVVNEMGDVTIDVPAGEVALVLTDIWNVGDSGPEPSQLLLKQQAMLAACREAGVTIIHAPSPKVAKKYQLYHSLTAEMEEYRQAYQFEIENPPPFLKRPPRSDLYKQTKGLRSRGRKIGLDPNRALLDDLKISKYVAPVGSDYIVASHDEYRYVLWREQITTLLYIGADLDECVMQRATGIGSIVGRDDTRLPYTVIVVEDCVKAGQRPDITAAAMTEAMIAYLSRKLAFIANSAEIEFLNSATERNSISDTAAVETAPR